MALTAYLIFTPVSGSGVTIPASDNTTDPKSAGLSGKLPFSIIIPRAEALYPVLDYSAGLEQTVNLSSQSSGTGGGKVAFTPFTLTRRIDSLTPLLVQTASAGTPLRYLDLFVTRAGDMVATPVLCYRFGLVAVKRLNWSADDEVPREEVSFEYGGLATAVARTRPDGATEWNAISGWNRVKNVRWNGTDPVS